MCFNPNQIINQATLNTSGEDCASFFQQSHVPVHPLLWGQLSYHQYLEEACAYTDTPHFVIRRWDASGANGSLATACVILSP